LEILKKLRKNRLFMLGLAVPLVFQIIYLCIAIPAIKDGNNRMTDFKVAIVNEDQTLGKEVTAQLIRVLPFKVTEFADLNGSLKSMNDSDFNMVMYIAPDFTAKIQAGGARVAYYINQSVPSMTKQAMEKVAGNINLTLNENVFGKIRDSIKQHAGQTLSQSGLPASALAQISGSLSAAFDSLKYTLIESDLQKINNADGFAQTVMPFFIFLTYFIGCIVMTILHTMVNKSLGTEISRGKILVTQLVVDIIVALIIPCVVVGLAAAFGIPFSLGLGPVWLLLTVGFLALLFSIQMFTNWFGIAGLAIVPILFPLQLVSSGLIYAREILPAFYSSIGNYLPAGYFGDGMLKTFYGNLSISKDIWVLLLMAGICLVVSALTLFKKEKTAQAASKLDAQ
jgi:uncharacterized phage infection (PIP) family protein YhgE